MKIEILPLLCLCIVSRICWTASHDQNQTDVRQYEPLSIQCDPLKILPRLATIKATLRRAQQAVKPLTHQQLRVLERECNILTHAFCHALSPEDFQKLKAAIMEQSHRASQTTEHAADPAPLMNLVRLFTLP